MVSHNAALLFVWHYAWQVSFKRDALELKAYFCFDLLFSFSLKNSIFSQSRLIQALQSQWNLFSSIRLSRNQLNQSGVDDPDNTFVHNRRRTETTATFLSTSLERNSFRYASRRKYKTQSLANPFRHADTNYPVYIHEALFMPEFS